MTRPDSSIQVGCDRLVECIRDMSARYIAKTGNAPRTLILVGGSALAMHGIRETSDDVDLYSPDPVIVKIARDVEAASGFPVDVTMKKNLWGDLNIYDIEEDALVMKQIKVGGHTVDIAALSVETLFVVKANTFREKDRDDLPGILGKTSIERVLERISNLWKKEPTHEIEIAVSNTISELQLASGRMITRDDFIRVDEEIVSEWRETVFQDFPWLAPSSMAMRA
jgi:hypothetical protein